MEPLQIAVVTTTRADYGLLYWLIRDLQEDPECALRLIVSGTHLSRDFGHTVEEIERDRLPIAARVELDLKGGSPFENARSIGNGTVRFAETFERLKPDLVVILGDRFELLAVCAAAVSLRIPIAHIHGGETTEGALDEQVRHAVTKMAHLHFAAAEPYRKNLIQMGEAPDRVFNFGAPALEHLRRTSFMNRRELEEELCFSLDGPTLLVTYHPETLEREFLTAPVEALLEAVAASGTRAIFTYANADAGGRRINEMIETFARGRKDRLAVPSLGHRVYLSLLREVRCLVGNSSSGLIEAPSLKKPSVNIGGRQKGRLRAPSVIDCEPTAEAIGRAIRLALSDDFVRTRCTGENPYGSGDFSQNAIAVLKSFGRHPDLLRKSFHSI
jgi:UDP-hydrolysing UDP-N-acetyl-D-glucosamine 2-epimerase